MTKRTVTVELPGYVVALCELEAKASGRPLDEHVAHKLLGIYKGLHRVCDCGFFLYSHHLADWDKTCARCGRGCCHNCARVVAGEDVCARCAR